MPVDPMIARGIQPIDVSNTLAQIAMLRQRDQVIADDRAQTAALQQQIQAKQQAAAEHEQALVEAISRNDWATVARLDPDVAREIRAQHEAENPPPGQLYQTAEGFLPAEQAVGKMPYQAPLRGDAAAPKPGYGAVEKGVNPQTGKTDSYMVDDFGNVKWLGIEPPAPQQQLSPKDTSAALQKINQIGLARKQLNAAKQRFSTIKNSFSAGPGGRFVPTPAGKAFDASIDQMRNTFTSITRVPGIGAMSDYETRLAQAQFPERGNYENVTEQQLQALDDMLNTLEQGYRGLLGQESATPVQQAAPQARPPLESFQRK